MGVLKWKRVYKIFRQNITPFLNVSINNLWVKNFYKLCLKCEMLDVQVIANATLMKFQVSC